MVMLFSAYLMHQEAFHEQEELQNATYGLAKATCTYLGYNSMS